MRRSFGSGPGAGGGGMLRTVNRALRSGGGAPTEPFSSANSTSPNSRNPKQFNKHQTAPPNAALTLSSSSGNTSPAFSTLINPPISGAPGAAAATWESRSDGDDADAEWECVDGANHEDDQRALFLYDDLVFGTVPSTDEVDYAISALQQVFDPSSYPHTEEKEDNFAEVSEQISSSSESGTDWIEPSLNIRGSRILRPFGSSDSVFDAFHLLQTEASIQRMVMALSSDKAVWEAVLNNEAVKELRGSIDQGESRTYNADEASDDNSVKDILSQLIANTKAKIMQVIDKITKLANEVFKSMNGENDKGGEGPFQEKLKTSLFLSIVVLLIVVVTRAKR